jgi:hypothetical protein
MSVHTYLYIVVLEGVIERLRVVTRKQNTRKYKNKKTDARGGGSSSERVCSVRSQDKCIYDETLHVVEWRNHACCTVCLLGRPAVVNGSTQRCRTCTLSAYMMMHVIQCRALCIVITAYAIIT